VKKDKMDYGEKKLNELLKKFEKMAKEEYLYLHNKTKERIKNDA